MARAGAAAAAQSGGTRGGRGWGWPLELCGEVAHPLEEEWERRDSPTRVLCGEVELHADVARR